MGKLENFDTVRPPAPFRLRPARLADVPRLEALIAASARALGQAYYSQNQIEGALRGAWGVDRQLIRDRTYFVATIQSKIVAGGGWSYRKTLFGGDQNSDRKPQRLDSETDPARIRAFFVHPDWARRGIGRALLARCENAARRAGFKTIELMATLPGQRLYAACGYQSRPAIEHPLGDDLSIRFVPMHKRI